MMEKNRAVCNLFCRANSHSIEALVKDRAKEITANRVVHRYFVRRPARLFTGLVFTALCGCTPLPDDW